MSKLQAFKKKVEKLKGLLPENILKNPELFNMITEVEFDKKIVREIDTRKTIFLCMCGMWVKNHNLASYNLMVNSESGAGKDYVVKAIGGILPPERYVYKTRISPTVFTYWHNERFEPNWTWSGKVFYNEDIKQSVLNSDVFKVFLSSGSTAVITIKQVAIEITIKGKPVMIVTTAKPKVGPQITRRFNILNLDESVKQTKAIMERHAIFAKEGIVPEYNEKITEALRYLERVKIKVPFGKELVKLFPPEHIIMRTHFIRFIDYIKASCALHQKQRQRDKEGNYLANAQDYEIARIALHKTTTNPFLIPLTKDQQKLLKIIKKLGLELYHSVKEIEVKVNFLADRQLRRHLDRLTEFRFLKKELEEREGIRHKVICYKVNEIADFKLPPFSELGLSGLSRLTTKTAIRTFPDKPDKPANLTNLTNMTNLSNSKEVSLESLYNNLIPQHITLTPNRLRMLAEHKQAVDKIWETIDDK